MRKLWHNPFVRYGALITGLVAAAGIVFPGTVRGLLRADQFMPHATCYLRNPQIILLHVSSDVAIGVAYIAIALTLSYLAYKGSREIPFHWMFLAFGLFIITCGLTHLMEVWTVWQPVYWLSGYVKLVCAVASVATAIALYRLVPRVFALIQAVKVSEERQRQLEAANAELEAFTSSVSHDLRAPLRAVQGMAGMLLEDHGTKLEPEARTYLDRIVGAAEHMDRLTHDLLEYSRMSRSPVELVPVDLKAAAEEAKRAVEEDARQSHAEIRVEGSSTRVLGNPTLLTQVLVNLLSNALKFVAPGVSPRVAVRVTEESRTVRVAVKDNGIGIAAEYQAKIFRIFERLHSAQEYPGTGLGLAIVDKAVQQMHGRLGVESQAGAGSCFWVELPKAEGA